MTILLNDQEIYDVAARAMNSCRDDEDIKKWRAKQALIRKQAKRIIQWGNMYCEHQNTPRRMCGHCWDELVREIC